MAVLNLTGTAQHIVFTGVELSKLSGIPAISIPAKLHDRINSKYEYKVTLEVINR